MAQPTARDRLLELLRPALREGTLVKLTLGKPHGADPTLRNVFVRPVALKSGSQLAFVYRHTTRDITKNLPPEEAITAIESMLGAEFLDLHLFTNARSVQFEGGPNGGDRVRITAAQPAVAANASPAAHDRPKGHLVAADAPWLRGLGVTNERGQPREGMADKFRQIQKFAELLVHLLADAYPESGDGGTRRTIVDMGSGKGYLTFALAHVLGGRAQIRGVEVREELVTLCNRVARETGLAGRLAFTAGTIASAPLPAGDCDVLIALHACDTATDDALARGVAAGAGLLVVAPCCQKELRRQLTAPPVLAGALRHGIFQERQSEFVTDALRAQLLECVGYRTKVFEFISTEHTAKNLMLAAIRTADASEAPDAVAVERVREFAAFYGVREQQLARHLGIGLS